MQSVKMSETVNQNSPKVENQVPEQKKWKKSSMRKWTGLVLLISALLVFAGISFGLLFWINVALLIIVEIYGRVTGKMEIVQSQSSAFITDQDRVISSFVVPGRDAHPSAYDFDKRYH